MLEDIFEEAKRMAREKNAEVIVHTLYVLDVCRLDGGREQCRYLGDDDGKQTCLKLTNLKEKIDKEIQLWEAQISPDDFNYDPPLGDNCAGKKL